MIIILNIIIIILILGLIILVHELGHLIACKLTNVYVEEFAVGLGPKIYSKKRGETIYSLRAFPIGGFNKIKGEDYEEGEDKDPRSLRNQRPLVKAFIYLSGVLMNILLAVAIFYITLASMSFQWPIDPTYHDFEPVFGKMEVLSISEDVKYEGLVEGGFAQKYNLPESGIIKAIDGEELKYSFEATQILTQKAGQDIVMNICEEKDLCTHYNLSVSEEGLIGVMLLSNSVPYVQYEGSQKPFVGFLHIFNWGKLIGIALGDIFSQASETGDYEKVKMSIAGPVGLYVIIDYVRDLGMLALIDITANISLSIAIFNLLPIPALDGGRAVMLLGEVIAGRKMNKKVEAWAIQISFFLLLLLMVVILFKDVIYFDKLKDLFN